MPKFISVLHTFNSLGLSAELLNALQEKGFQEPTSIQQEVIPQLIQQPNDLIGLAQTGTGKTAAFGLPLLQLVDPELAETQALIVAPTRELAQQITAELEAFSKYTASYHLITVYGGASVNTQIKAIKKNTPRILVATPGRLIDLLDRNVVKLETVDYVVLDEADEMLNMGFKEDIDRILKRTPEGKFTWLFSATMPPEISKLTRQYMTNPIKVSVDQKAKVNAQIEHQYMLVKHTDKREALKRVLDVTPDAYAVVFCRTKRETQLLADQLLEGGYNAEALHGDLSQDNRDKVMNRFRKKLCSVLVCTDVAARGIDVDDVTHVIHISLPDDRSYYTHRSGRTARAGKQGISIAIVSGDELTYMRSLEKQLGIKMSRVSVPNADQIAQNRLQQWINEVYEKQPIRDKALNDALIEAFEDLSKEDLIKSVAAMAVDRFELNRSKRDLNIEETNIRQSGKGKSSNRGKGKADNGQGRKRMRNSDQVFISVGSQDGMNVPNLLGLIHKKTGLNQRQIGDIRLRRNHSIVEVPSKEMKQFIQKLNGIQVKGRSVVAKKDRQN